MHLKERDFCPLRVKKKEIEEMKKIASVVLVMVMAAAMAACSDSKKVESTKSTGGETTTTASTDGEAGPTDAESDQAEGTVEVSMDISDNFVFKYKETEIRLGDKPDAVMAALGDAKNTLDVPSCAHDGTDHVYTYDNIVVTVYSPADGSGDYISDVRVISDLVATPEGLEIGMDIMRAREIYGEADKTTDKQWFYKRGTSEMIVTVQNDKVVEIEYMIP